jgi:hypothetical protein
MEERPTFACYPFVLRSTIILPTDYRGDHPKLATKVCTPPRFLTARNCATVCDLPMG